MLNEVHNVIKMIELVKNRPAIYDFTTDEHNNRANVDNLWNEIANEVGTTPAECRRKWGSLRNALSRDVRNEKEAALTQCRKKKWYLADHLEFLRHHLHQRSRMPKSDVQVDESMEGENENYLDLSTQDVINEYLSPEEIDNLERKNFITKVNSSGIVDGTILSTQSIKPAGPSCSTPIFASPSISSAISSDGMRLQQSSNEINANLVKKVSPSLHETPNKYNVDEIEQHQRAERHIPPKSFPHQIQNHHINQSSSRRTIIEDEIMLLDERNMTFFRSIIPDILRLSDRKQRLYKQSVLLKLNEFLDEQET